MNCNNLLFPLSGALIGSGVDVLIRNIVNYVKYNEFKKLKLINFLNFGMLFGFISGVRLNSNLIECENISVEEVPVKEVIDKNLIKNIIEKEN